jgi:hypothetical protein
MWREKRINLFFVVFEQFEAVAGRFLRRLVDGADDGSGTNAQEQKLLF